jgi:hypothetical protein
MPHRRTWPKGLRVIFWFCILGFAIGIGQTLYWLLVTHEFFPELTIQGGYAAIAFVLTVICVVAGALSYRCAFAIASFITAAFHLGTTLYFNFGIFSMMFQDMLGGRWQFLYQPNATMWIYTWNWICILGNGAICYYLARYEFRFLRVLAA